MSIATEHLSRSEKLRIIEQLWDELSHSPEGIESPDWHADALHDAERAYEAGQVEMSDWNQAKARLRQGGE